MRIRIMDCLALYPVIIIGTLSGNNNKKKKKKKNMNMNMNI